MSGRFGMRLLMILGFLVLVAIITAGILAFKHRPVTLNPSTALETANADDDPRRTFDTPFENVRPNVAYVGDAACIECHQDIARHYARHPMGRALAPTAGQPPVEPLATTAQNPFEKWGNTYAVVMRDGKMFHREERRDASGKVAAVTEYEAKYAVGSGTRGKSYFVELEGRLFQSPISWFSEKKIWDISPGYVEERHFTRTMTPPCLYCHCNKALHEPGTLNTYRTPVFDGFAIGCERCHGPGEKHVKLRESAVTVAKPDHSIVNPRQLSPLLRDSVCEQCHLQGEHRVFRRGRDTFDFRPGLPLDLFISVHVRPPGETASFRSVGQNEQLRLSLCYQGSKGELGCISCHDPHRRPDASERVAYYRGKCQTCHADKGCSMPSVERLKVRADDSCIDCHMSKDGSRNIPHTAVTDHRILRKPLAAASTPSKAPRMDELPIVNFHHHRPGFADAERDRDTGIALIELMRQGKGSPAEMSRLAEPLLIQALKNRPDDVDAWAARGYGLAAIGRTAQALEAFSGALAVQAKHEPSLLEAAMISTASGKTEDAINYWKRIIEVNPFQPYYHMELARLYAQRREWVQARRSCERVIKLAPITIDARVLLVTCLVKAGELQQARDEAATILAMRPANEAELRRVLEAQLR